MHSIVYGNLRIEILTDVGSRLERVSLQRMTPQLLGRRPTGSARDELPTLLGREEDLFTRFVDRRAETVLNSLPSKESSPVTGERQATGEKETRDVVHA